MIIGVRLREVGLRLVARIVTKEELGNIGISSRR